jgi:hypothetical protein
LWKKVTVSDYVFHPKEKVALLAWCVKIFWAPLMIFWFTDHFFALSNSFYNVFLNPTVPHDSFITLFNNHLFWFCFNIILSLDVFFFTMGYLIEMPYLKNTIKSVEPTFFGWFVALACYPPFNGHVTDFIGWSSSDFPQFTSSTPHIFFNCMILLLMGIYSWASLALGWKASNLTNR